MQVIVLGGGVVGTASAWYLAQRGARVVVVDRQAGPALETSHANAGQVSPGYAAPWAAPGIPLKALKWLCQRHAPLAMRPDGTVQQLKWLLAMLANCTTERYAVNKNRMLRLAEYSRDCLRSLRADTGIEYEQRTGGTLQLFRTRAQLDAVRRDMRVLDACGVPYELLDAGQLARAEPALVHVQHKLTGGLRLPGDETGDCHLFTQRLAEKAAALGVVFRFGQQIEAITACGSRITGVQVDGELLRADAYVMALGSYSRELLLPLGLDIPVYPVKGYSLTLPIVRAGAAPVSTVLDETYKVAITRFDDRIRVGGMAELVGFDLRLNPRRRATLEMVVNDLFPGSGAIAQGEFWTGLRPMTPDGTPIVGGSPYRNLFINTGHGTLGWTMACGSGQLLADLIHGHRPAISTDGLDMGRYGSAVRSAPRPATDGIPAT